MFVSLHPSYDFAREGINPSVNVYYLRMIVQV